MPPRATVPIPVSSFRRSTKSNRSSVMGISRVPFWNSMRAREELVLAGNDAFRLRSQSVECDGLALSVRLGSDEAFGRVGSRQFNVRAFHIGKSRIRDSSEQPPLEWARGRRTTSRCRNLRAKSKRLVAREPIRRILAHWLTF